MAEIEGAVHRYAEASGGRWHWVEAGSGPAVVLLHGMPESWYAWRAQIPVLAREHRVLAVDLKGFGLSDKREGDYSLRALAQELAELVEQLGVETVRLVGHDLGGLVAAQLAAARPERVAALVLVATPVGQLDLARWPDYREFRQAPEALPTFLRDPGPWLHRWYDATVDGGADALPPQMLAHYAAELERRGAARAIGRLFRDLEIDARGRLGPASAPDFARVRAPLLVIAGDRDLLVPLESFLPLERRAPGFRRLAVIDDAGHYPHEERPGECTRQIVRFLGEVAGGGQ